MSTRHRGSRRLKILDIQQVLGPPCRALHAEQPIAGGITDACHLETFVDELFNGRLGTAGDMIENIEEPRVGEEHHQMLALKEGGRHWNLKFAAGSRVAFIGNPARMNFQQRRQQAQLIIRRAQKHDVVVLGRADKAMHTDGMAADDSKRHAVAA